MRLRQWIDLKLEARGWTQADLATRAKVSARTIHAVEKGDSKAAGELLPLVYEELRRLAASKMAHEASGQTLQPTALVHEAYLRLVGSSDQP